MNLVKCKHHCAWFEMHFKFFSCKKNNKRCILCGRFRSVVFSQHLQRFQKTTLEFIPQKINFLEDYLGKT